MYDVVIIGGGPGGLAAAIYAQRARLKTLLVEREYLGGQIAVSDVIENYPGFPTISGAELMEKFEEHARGLGLEVKLVEVESIEERGKEKLLKTSEGELVTKTIIVATGAKPRRLGVPGEVELTGKGVSYCATCDGPFFRGQDVVVVGGGDTAIKDAVYLSKIAAKVSVVHRRDKLRAEKILQEKALSTPNIEMYWSHIMVEVKGDKVVEGVVLKNLKDESAKELKVEGAFIFVGTNPSTGFIDVEKDDRGFIKTNQRMETSVEGIYAVGDCRTTPLLQVATAVGDGAIAAFCAGEYVEEKA
ncbi:MAG: thioredoxin-disulfide reductase [Deltaproteobacteria bacterium]|nr:thioredoxin-disulfide reductase [Deltaproteobacteria bacterium]